MTAPYPVTKVTPSNLERVGFFCYMSARKTQGYACKQAWVRAGLADGLRIKMVLPPEGRGFIEYLPGEAAWRAVNAPGYFLIHCLWVVGKSKGRGVATQLMDLCEQEALAQDARGVAMLTGKGLYMIREAYLQTRGYIPADTAPGGFTLMVKKFKDGLLPSFCGDWDQKAQALGQGLTVLRADQCPYLENAATGSRKIAEELAIPFKDIRLNSPAEVREKSPSAFGVFSLVYNGCLIGDQYTSRQAVLDKIKELGTP